jgi:hypothetical protein
MTIQVGIVNLLLETHGGARRQGDATWYILVIQFFFFMTNGAKLFIYEYGLYIFFFQMSFGDE